MPVKTADRDAGVHDVADIGAQLREHDPPGRTGTSSTRCSPTTACRRGRDGARAGAGLGAGVLGWTEATGAPQVEIALPHPIALLASTRSARRRRRRRPGPRARRARSARSSAGSSRPQRDVQQGVDIIIAQGTEAGGHTGEIATMVLVPEVVDAVGPDVPVLAAGGIGTRSADGGRAGARRAGRVDRLDLAHRRRERHRRRRAPRSCSAATSRDTVRSRSMTGKPARQLRTAWTEAWEAPESPGHAADAAAVHPAPRTPRGEMRRGPHRELIGMPVGQIVGRMNQVRPTKHVVFDMVEEYIDVTQRLASDLDD